MREIHILGDDTGESLYATRDFKAGETVLVFPDAEFQEQRDRYTVEHPSGGHFYHPLLAKCAHSCDPNCIVSFEQMALIAVRPIRAQERVSFDYGTTEKEFTHPFRCLCAASRCRGWIG